METYFDPSQPGSFGGVQGLVRQTNAGSRQVKEWLMRQDAYTFHKPARLHFLRRKTITRGINDLWHADLVDVSSLSKYNDSYRYLLTCIDVLSKRAQVVPLKNKTGLALREACKSLIAESGPKFLPDNKGLLKR